VVDDCTHSEVGASSWRLHVGDGSGFASSATTWDLPSGYEQAFDMLAGRHSCTSSGYQEWTIADLTRDGQPDLAVVDDCTHSEVGVASWRVHLADASGFDSSASTWDLPTGYEQSFDMVAGRRSCTSSGYQEWATTDLTGDRLLDLVVVDDCDHADVGTASWSVHPSECP